MMEATIKEELSLHIFSAMAARAGYHTTKPRMDLGDDLLLYRSGKMEFRNRYTNLGKYLAVQLKTTTEKQVSTQKQKLVYDLEAKNYDDLVFRKNEWHRKNSDLVPMFLALLVLPDEAERWLEVNLSQKTCTLNGLFYWYFPEEKADYSPNENSQRIFIPADNQVNLNFFNRIFTQFLKTEAR